MDRSPTLFARSLLAIEWATIVAGVVMTSVVLWSYHNKTATASPASDASPLARTRSACEPGATLSARGELRAWLDGAELPNVTANPPTTPQATLVARGAPLYATHCAACHGAKGGGDGPLAASLAHPVTSFQSGVFELRSTEHDSLPTDLDLFRAITRGVHGTGMPPWFALPDVDRWALVAYVKSLTPDFADDTAPPPIAVVAPAETTDRLAHGAQLYASAGCASCHGTTGAGDGPGAMSLVFKSGAPARPRAFGKDRFHRGARASDIYLTIASGLDGSPMASFAKVMSSDDLWDLAMYVHRLAPTFVDRPNGMSCPTPHDAPADEVVGVRELLRSLPLTK
jgi:cytochrome c oxidase cbb3-type subunit I/II